MGISVSGASIELGAVVIEKYFTFDGQDKDPDSEYSLEPSDLKILYADTKISRLALRESGFEFQIAGEGSKVLEDQFTL
jgi:N-acetylneuraminate synthase